jgi:osmotically inducible protein OsmC
MEAHGSATWTGSWRGGHGRMATRSDAVDDVEYTYRGRFVLEGEPSPEELLATALAACVNQAVANNLDQEGVEARSISTSAALRYGLNEDGRPTIEGAHLVVEALVPGVSTEAFDARVVKAVKGCSISRVLQFESTVTAALLTEGLRRPDGT